LGRHEQRGSTLISLYLERRADLIRFFTVRLRSGPAAEDLVQDIYVRLSSRPTSRTRRPTSTGSGRT